MMNFVIRDDRRDAVVRDDETYDWYANKPFEFVRKIMRNVERYIAFAEDCRQ